jgi:hypothetical protein
MDPQDAGKLANVKLAIDIQGTQITLIAMQARHLDGTYEIFHQDQFSTPE